MVVGANETVLLNVFSSEHEETSVMRSGFPCVPCRVPIRNRVGVTLGYAWLHGTA
jgi:hypothetical protein